MLSSKSSDITVREILGDNLEELNNELRSQFGSDILDRTIKNVNVLDIVDFFKFRVIYNYKYDEIASRFAVYNLHFNVIEDNSETFSEFIAFIKSQNGIINDATAKFVERNATKLNAAINHDNDFTYTLFGLNTLIQSYLLKVNRKVVEKPQYMLMRVACGIWAGDDDSVIDRVLDTYHIMSNKIATHATPTLFNSGTITHQMSSCFLFGVEEDSIDNIYKTLHNCALISKSAGGIGISVTKVRSKGSEIKGTNGVSQGIVPMLEVYDSTARYCDQGGGRRPGSIAVYLEPWHKDTPDFLKMFSSTSTKKYDNLFPALWVPDIFMRRVVEKGKWTLLCPSQCTDLIDVYGEEFDKLYEKYEREIPDSDKVVMNALDLYRDIVRCQFECGMPYIGFKDTFNAFSNQRYLGTIKNSNLCIEIAQYSDAEEYAVCNLASIALNKHVINGEFDFDMLEKTVRTMVRNLDRIIDQNYYPTKETKTSNFRHRPIGLGAQGLADVFNLLRMDFDSVDAMRFDARIFETMYYTAIDESINLNIEAGLSGKGGNTPLNKLGEFHWEHYTKDSNRKIVLTKDWESLRQKVLKHHTKNSLLIAVMPTAGTSQILGNNESVEPYTQNIYTRRVNAGDYYVINKQLFADIEKYVPENKIKDVVLSIVNAKGSIQHLTTELPEEIRRLYRTTWELVPTTIVQHAIARQPFVDQAQSMNLYVNKAEDLTKCHNMAWKYKLKTGNYYVRTRPAVDPNAMKFTATPEPKPEEEEEEQICKLTKQKLEDGTVCFSCSG